MRVPSDPSSRVLAVTGAHGFIGREVIRRLLADRRFSKILALDVRPPELSDDKLRYHRTDLTLPSAAGTLSDVLRDEGADTLLHAAFLSSPSHDQSWAHELEAIGTIHALSAASSAKLRRVVVRSETLVYGAGAQNPNLLNEDRLLFEGPQPGFLADKVEAERQARAFARENPETSLCILRTAPMLGPSGQGFFARFFSRPLCPSLLGHDPLLQFVHEQDAIDAFLLALLCDARGAFNIVGEGVLPYSTVLAMLGRLPLPLPRVLLRPLGRALWALQASPAPPELLDFLCYLCVADGARARRELGFAPRYDIRATLDDFIGVGLPAADHEPAALIDEGGAPMTRILGDNPFAGTAKEGKEAQEEKGEGAKGKAKKAAAPVKKAAAPAKKAAAPAKKAAAPVKKAAAPAKKAAAPAKKAAEGPPKAEKGAGDVISKRSVPDESARSAAPIEAEADESARCATPVEEASGDVVGAGSQGTDLPSLTRVAWSPIHATGGRWRSPLGDGPTAQTRDPGSMRSWLDPVPAHLVESEPVALMVVPHPPTAVPLPRRVKALSPLGRRYRDLALRGRSTFVDDFGLDPKALSRYEPALDWLYRRYFRVEAEGLHHVPDYGRAMLVGNRAGTLPYDSLLLSYAVRREHPLGRALRPLLEDYAFHAPYLGPLLCRLGGVRACPENAERLLQGEQLVGVFPEGQKGSGKRFADRYQLQRFGRGGFIKLALRTRTPILPVAIIGAEESQPLLGKIGWLGRPLGLPHLPITPTFPWLGPLGLLPLPSKWHIVIGEPMHLSGEYGEGAAEDLGLVGRLSEKVRGRIQQMLDEVLGRRRSVWAFREGQ